MLKIELCYFKEGVSIRKYTEPEEWKNIEIKGGFRYFELIGKVGARRQIEGSEEEYSPLFPIFTLISVWPGENAKAGYPVGVGGRVWRWVQAVVCPL